MGEFAFKMDKSAIPKLILNSFPDGAEYLGQLVMRLYDYDASKVEIQSKDENCIIVSNAILGEEELDLIENLKTSPQAIPYSIVFKYFKEMCINSKNINMHVFQSEDKIISESTSQSDVKGTTIMLSERRTYQDEISYCKDKFEYSDLEILVNDQRVNKTPSKTSYTFETEDISGKIYIGENLGGQHFYYNGKKIIEKDFDLPHLMIVYHEHPYSPVFSHNDLSDYDESQIEKSRNEVINKAIEKLIDEVPHETLRDIIIFNSNANLFTESTLNSIKEHQLFNNGELSYNDLLELDDVYLNEGDFELLVGSRLKGKFEILSLDDAELYSVLGGQVTKPSEVPMYKAFVQLSKLPNYKPRLKEFEAEHVLEDITLKLKQNGDLRKQVHELGDYLEQYDINVRAGLNSETPIIAKDDGYLINVNNPGIQYFLSLKQDIKFSPSPILSQLLSMHYENPENQIIGNERKNPEELRDFIIKKYLEH